MAAVVEVDRVSKRYLLGEHHGTRTNLRETLSNTFRKWRGHPPGEIQEIWSLDDVSFAVEEGSALGVVGNNGAGKSTLMKVINGITAPTSGACRTRGRVGSLLEVGTGFHGELTGVENAYLNGAILGMSRREVRPRLEEIVEFAGLAGFMDTPVKRYSSGMYLRLGFAVAAHMTADILLVDEALAVGDVAFQQKCLAKMNEIRTSGRTVLFISHYMQQLGELCSTTLWMEHGQVRAIGPTRAVIDDYLRSYVPESMRALREPDPSAPAQILGVALLDDAGNPRSTLHEHEGSWIEVDTVVNEAIPGINLQCRVETATGVRLLNEGYDGAGAVRLDVPGRYRVRCRLPAILAPEEYQIGLWLGTPQREIEELYHVLGFRVDGSDGRDGSDSEESRRLIRLAPEWRVTRVDDHLGD